MEERLPASSGICADSQGVSDVREEPVLYRQISYEELEECVLCVRDSISEFYLAPQGEISFAAVESALADPDIFSYDGGADPGHGANGSGDGAAGSKDGVIFWPGYPDFTGFPDADGYPDGFSVFDDDGLLRIGYNTVSHSNNGAAGAERDLAEYAENGPEETSGAGGQDAPQRGGEAGKKIAAPARRRHFQPYAITVHQFYKESAKKRAGRRRAATLKYMAACFFGTLLGGALVLICLLTAFPAFNINIGGPSRGEIREIVHTLEYADGESVIEAVYAKASPSVVGVRVSGVISGYGIERWADVEGSGIIIDAYGYILTNADILTPAFAPFAARQSQAETRERQGAAIEVILQGSPGAVYGAEIVARDVKTNIAVLKIDASDLPVAELGDSDLITPGEKVIAIGKQGGPDSAGSVTDGIVSGYERGEANLIHTNAVINVSNSGGALVNARGQVIGVNIGSGGPYGYEGFSFAVPINAARHIAENLIEFSYVRGRAKLGIRYSESFDMNYDSIALMYPNIPKGVYVEYVEPLSGAFKAGVVAGDIITKLMGTIVNSCADLLIASDGLAPGDIVGIEVFRADEFLYMELEVSEETGDGQGVI